MILGIDSLKQCNPQISWIDSRVTMPCLGKKDGVCKSSANCVGSALSGLCGTNVSQCSNVYIGNKRTKTLFFKPGFVTLKLCMIE